MCSHLFWFWSLCLKCLTSALDVFLFLIAINIGIQKWQLLKHVYFSNNFLNESLKSMAQLKERVNYYKITKKEKKNFLYQWVLKKLVRFLWICVRTCACVDGERWGWCGMMGENLNTKVGTATAISCSQNEVAKFQSLQSLKVLCIQNASTPPLSMYIFTATCNKNFSAECQRWQQPAQLSWVLNAN